MAKYKYILTAIIILCSFISYAQPAQYTPMTASGYQMKRLKVDSTLHLPSFCGVPNLLGSTSKDGALAIDTCGGLLYMWTRSGGWDTINVSGGGAGTISTLQQVLNTGEQAYNKNIILYDSISPNYGYKGIQLYQNNGYQSGGTEILVNSTYNNTGLFLQAGAMTQNEVRPKIKFGNNVDDIATTFTVAPSTASGLTFNLPPNNVNGSNEDTLATLADVRNASATTIDTTSLSNRINSKLSISDTATMLSPYLRAIDTTNKFVNRLTRTSGKDSIIYFIGGTRYAIKDSVGTGGSSQNGRFGNDTATVVMVKVHNDAGVTLTNGKVVALTTSGNNNEAPAVRLANNKGDSTSANTLGFVTGTIANQDTGWVILSGKIEKVNTSAFSNGDIIYLDSVNGNWTKTKPQAPYHMVYLGVVVKSNAGNGSIFVKAQNGYELDEIHDVKITSPLNNQVLAYSDTQRLWKNRNIYTIVDTTSLSSRINLKLNATDTASLSSRINQTPTLTAYQILGSTIKAFPIGITGFAQTTGTLAHVNQRMWLTAIYIPQTTTVTGAKWILTSAGSSYVGNANYNGLALYSYNIGTGLATRIDSTASDANTWATSLGLQSKAFVTPISLSPGIYYLSALCNGTATTFPSIAQNPQLNGATTYDLTSPARITGHVTGTVTPASFNLSTSTANTNLPILMLY